VHDFDPEHQPAPGSPLEKLMMKISNRPDFAGADWQPFQPEVKDWFLGRFEPLQETTRWVYVAFMDEAGNISDGPIADSIQALLQPGDTYPFDGKVDITDLNNVRNNFGSQGQIAILIGDAIGALNGAVDISDLNAVRNNFGSFVDSPLPSTAQRHAPEKIANRAIIDPTASDRPLLGRTVATNGSAAARDVLFGRFTEVGVDIDALLTAHRHSQKRGLRALK